MQGAGAPNTAQCGDNNTAWASSASSGTDWLRLTYAQAVIPTRIVIFESFNPGAVTLVEVLDQQGNSTIVYRGSPARGGACPGQLVIEVKGVSAPVKTVQVTIKHTVWSEIDAVQLIGVE